jgi:hypothetical protein
MGFFDLFKSTPKETSSECVCDICDTTINRQDNYFLTTQDVVIKKEYWEFILNHQWAYVYDLYKKTPEPNNSVFLGSLIYRQANQSTPWTVCESCSNLFVFDKTTANEYARKNHRPPHTGPADAEGLRLAIIAFTEAWNNVYHEEFSTITFVY